MGSRTVVRLKGDYALVAEAAFENRFFGVLRAWLLGRYLTAGGPVWEFGCGSGFNLVAAAKARPDVTCVGADWSPSAVQLMDDIAAKTGLPLSGQRFDFFHPDPALTLPPNTLAMTFAALEQLGPGFRTFADWLLDQRPRLVISMEPVVDHYDPQSLVDHLAIAYHRHRGYLEGYRGWAHDKAAARQINILADRRIGFGSLSPAAYSILVWSPG